ncbi:MAG: hypothetical protein QNK05_10515 [Myxococcota bacterium]|nr:hypothetical protein [Myxococcota bacterium]
MTGSDDRLLRNSLRANAGFSTLSGLAFCFAGAPIAGFIGVAPAALVTSVGVNLLGFAAALLWLSSRPRISLVLARIVIGLDLAWVAGTAVAIYADVFTRGGALAALAIAAVVLDFAVLQWLGVRRLERARPVATTSPRAEHAGAGA